MKSLLSFVVVLVLFCSVCQAGDVPPPFINSPAGGGSRIPGTSLTAGSVYYQGATGLALARANSSATLPAICIADSITSCMYSGVYRYSSSQSWTVGGPLYVSPDSAGALTQTVPTTAGQLIQRVGVALAADTILIMPSLDVGGI